MASGLQPQHGPARTPRTLVAADSPAMPSSARSIMMCDEACAFLAQIVLRRPQKPRRDEPRFYLGFVPRRYFFSTRSRVGRYHDSRPSAALRVALGLEHYVTRPTSLQTPRACPLWSLSLEFAVLRTRCARRVRKSLIPIRHREKACASSVHFSFCLRSGCCYRDISPDS